MNWTAILGRVKANLNQPFTDADTDEGTWTNAQILAEANDAQRIIVDETKCLTDTYTDSTVSAQAEYSKQSDFKTIRDIYFDDGNGFVPLTRTSIEQLDTFELEGKLGSPWRAESDNPVAWYNSTEDPDKYGLYPKPNSNGSSDLKVVYEDQITEMTVGTSIPYNGVLELYDYHSLIVYAVTMHFLDIEGENSIKWERRYNTGIRNLKKKVNQNYTPVTFSLVPRRRSIKRSASWPLGI